MDRHLADLSVASWVELASPILLALTRKDVTDPKEWLLHNDLIKLRQTVMLPIHITKWIDELYRSSIR